MLDVLSNRFPGALCRHGGEESSVGHIGSPSEVSAANLRMGLEGTCRTASLHFSHEACSFSSGILPHDRGRAASRFSIATPPHTHFAFPLGLCQVPSVGRKAALMEKSPCGICTQRQHMLSFFP